MQADISGLAVTEDIEKASGIISEAKNPLILCSPSLFSAASNLTLLTDICVIAVPLEANARGVVSNGLASKAMTYSEMAKGGVDLLYAVGEVPLTARPDVAFLIAQTSYMTDLAKEADLILPASDPLESKGTVTGYLGHNKSLSTAVTPFGSAKQHNDIFTAIAKSSGAELKVRQATTQKAVKVLSPFEKKPGLDPNPAEITESLNAAIIRNSRLAWFKDALEAAV